jgi:hypothetical protein
MSPEELFIHSVDKLRTIGHNPTDFNLLQASATLRLLLKDPIPLIHTVNRTFRTKIYFPIVPHSIEEMYNSTRVKRGLSSMSVVDLIDPSSFPNAAIEKLTLNEFLSYKIIYCKGEYLSVGEMIDFAANNQGGIHYDGELDGKFLDLRNMGVKLFPLFESDIAISNIRPITRITVSALTSLYLRIRA